VYFNRTIIAKYLVMGYVAIVDVANSVRGSIVIHSHN
jgi:hypothetical protein